MKLVKHEERLEEIAEQFGVDNIVVTELASMLGDDYDGLTSTLEDFDYVGLLDDFKQEDDELSPSYQYPEGFWDIYSPKAENVAIADISDHYEIYIPDYENNDVEIQYAMNLDDCYEQLQKVKELWAKDEKNVWIIFKDEDNSIEYHKPFNDDNWKELVSTCKEKYLVLSGQQNLF